MGINIRYGRLFKIPRKIAKRILCSLYPIVIKIWPLPKVLSIDETLDRIIRDKVSISRYGDGEFLYIIDKLNLPFQKQDPVLRNKMEEILKTNENHILIGLPIGYHSLNNLNIDSLLTWKSQIAWIYPRLHKYVDLKKTYYNSSISRPYMEYVDKKDCQRYFQKWRKIWHNRQILLIEGEKSRLGVKNDLFKDALSVERILAPKHNAFSKYDLILKEVLKHDNSKLILVALGPTATVMAFELSRLEYQTIDIGNLDIEYEWFLSGAKSKVKINGKYTSESVGGREVSEMNDEVYYKQILINLA